MNKEGMSPQCSDPNGEFGHIKLGEINSMINSEVLPRAAATHFLSLVDFLKAKPQLGPPLRVTECSFDTHFTTQGGPIDDFCVKLEPTAALPNWWERYKLRVCAHIELINGDDGAFVECCYRVFATNIHFDISNQGITHVTGLRLRDTMPGVYRLSLLAIQASSVSSGHRLLCTSPFRVFSKRKRGDLKNSLGEISIDDWPAFCAGVSRTSRQTLRSPRSRVTPKLRDLAALEHAPAKLCAWVEKARELLNRPNSGETGQQQPTPPRSSTPPAPGGDLPLIHQANGPKFWVAACSFESTTSSGLIPPFFLKFRAQEQVNWLEYDGLVTAWRTDADNTEIQLIAPFTKEESDTKSLPISREGTCLAVGLELRHEGKIWLKISLVRRSASQVVLVFSTLALEVVSPPLAEFDWLVGSVSRDDLGQEQHRT